MSEHTLTAPFQLGDTYWLPSTSPRHVVEACPVCAGTKVVTVLAGAERFVVECDACGLGYQGPQGTVGVWRYEPHAAPFIIASVTRLDAEGWTVKSTAGEQARFKTLCATEGDALAASKAACIAQEEHNMRQRNHRRKGVSKTTWTVRYHSDAIKKLERELAYHRSKLNASNP
jgi:hypothetical protein